MEARAAKLVVLSIAASILALGTVLLAR
jgi:hypothetical protein